MPIPPEYETELQAVIHALGDMKQPPGAVKWETPGTNSVGVLVSDTMMFQRGGPGGLRRAHRLVLRAGAAAGQTRHPGRTRADRKCRIARLPRPLQTPHSHLRGPEAAQAGIPRGAGKVGERRRALVVVDDDRDPFNAVHEWWNSAPLNYTTPREDLFDTLGITEAAKRGPTDSTILLHVGKGVVLYSPTSPAALSHQSNGSATAAALFRKAADAAGLGWGESSAIVLRRGPYLIAAGLDESPVLGDPVTLQGRFIPLFDSTLAMKNEFLIGPNVRTLLIDLDRLPKDTPAIAAAACSIENEKNTADSLAFRAAGVQDSRAAVAIIAPMPPASATVAGKPLAREDVRFADGLLRIFFANQANGVDVEVRW